MIATGAAVASAVASQVDQFHQLAGVVPPAARPYLPLASIAGFVLALFLVRSLHKDELEAATSPDVSSLRDAQLFLGNKIDRLVAAVTEATPRQFTRSQAQRLETALLPLRERFQTATGYRLSIEIFPLVGVTDAHDLAHNIGTALEVVFDVTVHPPSDPREDGKPMIVTGVLLLSPWEFAPGRCDDLLIAAFKDAGLTVKRHDHASGKPYMILIIGEK